MTEIDKDEVVIVRIAPDQALARVYVFCTSEYFIYEGLYRKAKTFDQEDKLQFAGVARQAARVVDLIRAFNPEIAAAQDELINNAAERSGGELRPVPKPIDRNPDVESI